MLRVLPGLCAGLFVIVIALAWLTSPVLAGQCGGASWYGPGFHGKKTASGSRFDQNAMTAAHRSLPFGTVVEVVDQRTGRTVTVTINDRGPFVRGRIIDLSKAAAAKLGMIDAGVDRVCMERH